jgi:entericidin B
MRQVKLLAGAVMALSLLAGCNTVRGVGKDLQAGGEAISQTSDEVKEFLTSPQEPTRTASAGEACDPAGKELKGRSDLPRCK